MGIDQIGKKGPPIQPSPAEITGRPPAAEQESSFELSTLPTSNPGPRVAGLETVRTALERLRSGEIDANGYLDLKVSEATSHLVNLPAGQLQSLRSSLRDRMSSDPALVELVRLATGGHPGSPDGDG
jgi:hypothetical protein